MGAKNTTYEYKDKRDAEFFRAYQNAKKDMLENDGKIVMGELLRRTVLTPASRFWVSLEMATRQVSLLERGLELKVSTSLYRDMYTEIYRRYLALRKSHPEMSRLDALQEVLEQPAPRFYLKEGAAHVLICRIKKSMRK